MWALYLLLPSESDDSETQNGAQIGHQTTVSYNSKPSELST